MRLLLDTHAFLWLVEGSRNLSAKAETALTDPLNDLFLSVASVWELAIKVGNGKLALSDPLDVYLAKWMAMYQLDFLAVESYHALAVVALPHHHRDPFDRMLIVQGRIEGLTLVTADPKFAPYVVPILW